MAIAIVIAPGDAPSLSPCVIGAGFLRDIEKRETAEVLIGSIRFSPEKGSTPCADRDVEVEIAVIIIVAEAVSVLVSLCRQDR